MPVLNAYLTVHDAAAAIEFYKKALGAEEVVRMPSPDGKRLIHAALKIGDSMLMLADDFSDVGADDCQSPQKLGGTTMTIHMHSPDVDQAMATAAAAGATITMPAEDMFWGDRYGKFRDPFGHSWSVATTKKQLTHDQMKAAAKEAFAEHKAQKNQQQQQQ